jgi:hypothetical protein
MIQWVVQNRELVKLIYGLIVALICLIIVFKTDKIFRISLHKGIRYFRNAFLFYCVGFLIRYVFGSNLLFSNMGGLYNPILKALFEFFMIMGGFFLLYSLLWKKIEAPRARYLSSLMNANILVLYLISIIIVSIDILYNSFYALFVSQIFLFTMAFAISFSNYLSKGKQRKFLMFYFIAMGLSLVAWGLNGLAALLLEWSMGVIITIYLINIIIFLIFLSGILNFTKH